MINLLFAHIRMAWNTAKIKVIKRTVSTYIVNLAARKAHHSNWEWDNINKLTSSNISRFQLFCRYRCSSGIAHFLLCSLFFDNIVIRNLLIACCMGISPADYCGAILSWCRCVRCCLFFAYSRSFRVLPSSKYIENRRRTERRTRTR